MSWTPPGRPSLGGLRDDNRLSIPFLLRIAPLARTVHDPYIMAASSASAITNPHPPQQFFTRMARWPDRTPSWVFSTRQ